MYKILLWDVDGTILDFDAAESAAIKKCFETQNLGCCTDEMVARYSAINKKYWQMLERGEITKPEVLVNRFSEFFESEGIDPAKAEAFNAEYQIRLGDTIVFRDDAFSLLSSLKDKGIRQYAVTNGTKTAQDKKLSLSGLIGIFDDVFISDVLGVEKPNAGFFDIVFDRIGVPESVDRSEVLIIGDSLTSDMQGGNNAGIDCCWYNPEDLENTKDLRLSHIISNLNEVKQLV